MTGAIAFLVIFSLLIFIHEFGHFLFAKLCGVTVLEFGFGYPPRLLKIGTWRGTEISLNVLPFGGFVRMAEHEPDVPGSLATKSRGTRALVFAGGAIMNVLLAIILYSITFMTGALTPYEGPGAGVYYVAPGSPAEQAGIMPGDTIVRINNVPVESVDQAVEMIKARLGQEIELTIRRDDKLLPPIKATPRLNPPPGEGALGVALDLPLTIRSYPVWKAIPLGIETTYSAVKGIYYGVQAAIRGQMPFQVSGPVGIYHTTARVAKTGLQHLIEFTAFLSLNLFLMNLLPLPALDGGRLVFVLLEWLRGGRQIPPEKEGMVHAIGMVILVALMMAITLVDFRRYFG